MAERTEKRRAPNAIQRFTRETVGELRKVTWPTTQEALSLTKIVLITLAAMALLLGTLDYIFSLIVTRLVAV